MTIEFKFSSEVYHARMRHSYTQKQVAEAISVSERWYQQIEKGERLPGALVTLRLILFLNIDVELFREEAKLIVPLQRR